MYGGTIATPCKDQHPFQDAISPSLLSALFKCGITKTLCSKRDRTPSQDSFRDSSPPPLEDALDDTVVENTECQIPVPSEASNSGPTDEKTSAAALPSTSSNPSGSPQTIPEGMKYWIWVKSDLPQVLVNFLTNIMENIENYSNLLDFVLVCDIP